MEKIIKINTENFNIQRDLLCDFCNKSIYTDHHKEEIYAIFWEDISSLYLEKYICETCFKKVYKNKKAIPFESANQIYKDALKRDFKRDWHGIIAPCSSVEEFRLLQEDPFLLELWGEKF